MQIPTEGKREQSSSSLGSSDSGMYKDQPQRDEPRAAEPVSTGQSDSSKAAAGNWNEKAEERKNTEAEYRRLSPEAQALVDRAADNLYRQLERKAEVTGKKPEEIANSGRPEVKEDGGTDKQRQEEKAAIRQAIGRAEAKEKGGESEKRHVEGIVDTDRRSRIRHYLVNQMGRGYWEAAAACQKGVEAAQKRYLELAAKGHSTLTEVNLEGRKQADWNAEKQEFDELHTRLHMADEAQAVYQEQRREARPELKIEGEITRESPRRDRIRYADQTRSDRWHISAIDGTRVLFDQRFAREEYRKMSPEARQKVDAEANRIFHRNHPGFDEEKSKAYRDRQVQTIKDELVARTGGRPLWEGQSSGDKVLEGEAGKEQRAVASDAAAARQDMIWADSAEPMSAKQFSAYVHTELSNKSVRFMGAERKVAAQIAERLLDPDLNSKQMSTPEGYQALRQLRQLSSDDRIRLACEKIRDEIYPRMSREEGRKAFNEGFPKFAEQFKNELEGKSSREGTGYRVEKVYHRGHIRGYEEIRAVISKPVLATRREEFTRGIDGREIEYRTKEDVCLGGINLERRGEFLSAEWLEKMDAPLESWKWEEDIALIGLGGVAELGVKHLLNRTVSAAGRYMGSKGFDTVASTAGKEVGGAARLTGKAVSEVAEGAAGTSQQIRSLPVDRPSVSSLGKTTSKEAYADTVPLPGASARPKGQRPPPTEPAIPSVEKPPVGKIKSTDAYADTAPLPGVSPRPKGQRLSVTEPSLPSEKPSIRGSQRGGGAPSEPSERMPLRSPEKKPPSTEAPIPAASEREADPWRTFMEFHPGRIGYEEYLGRDLYMRARALGIATADRRVLDEYVANKIYRAEVIPRAGTRDFVGLKEGVQRTVNEHVSKLESVGAQKEIRQSIQSGLDPDGLVNTIDNLRSQGFSNAQIRRYLEKQNDYIEYFKREFHLSDKEVRACLRANESIETGVAQRYWSRENYAWHAAKRRAEDLDSVPGLKQFQQWDVEAKAFARNKTREFMDRP